MAVVTLYARSAKDPASFTLPEPAQAEGRVAVAASGPVTITNGNSIASKIYLGKIPSSAILLPDSILYFGAVTGVTSLDVGLEKDGVSTVKVAAGDAVALLVAALDIHLAGSGSGISAVATADLGKRVWELLGLTKDPGYEYDIVAKLNAAATATAAISAFYKYARK